MKIIITTKNITLDKPLEVFVNDKIGSLEKYIGQSESSRLRQSFAQGYGTAKQGFGEPMEARVEIGLPSKHHRSGDIFYAEVNLRVGGKLMRATCQHEDLRVAIVDVKNEIQRQIKKFKTKKRDLSRKSKV